MKKRLLLIGAAGLAGVALLGFPGSAVLENSESNHVLLASVNQGNQTVFFSDNDLVSQSLYSPQELAAAILEDTVEVNNQQAVENLTTQAADSDKTDTTDKEEDTSETDTTEEKSAKELISNLNYDRLGIAKVDNWLNIREKPGTDQKIIGKLPKNAGCNIYSISDGWAKIKSGDVTGYVSSEYLVTDEEAEEYALEVGTKVATVKTETLNVRFLPATDSSIYTLVPVGEELDVSRENLTEKYVDSFIKDNFDSSNKEFIQDVDTDAMNKDLDNWLCVKIDSDKVFVSKDYVDISYQLKKAVAIKDLSSEASSSSGVVSTRAKMVQYAMQFLGNRYVWGGTSLTSGTDCSGFTMRIYQYFGYSIPRTSASQAAAATSISASDVQPGDLFFYGSGSSVSHVAMYIGNGQVIHASNEKDGIKISNAFYRTPLKIGRFINS